MLNLEPCFVLNNLMQDASKKRAFTLIELSVVIGMGMAMAAMLMALFSQQLALLSIFRKQSFLIDEAPLISLQVNRLVSKAERFRLHATVADALVGDNPTLDASPVMVMNYRQPDGSMRATILAFENGALQYYVVPPNGALGNPEWRVTNRPREVTFSVEEGVLRMNLTGPSGEVIRYSGTIQSGERIDRTGTIQQ